MQYNSKYLTAQTYALGKELFDSKSRTYTGNLPKVSFPHATANQTLYITASQRRDILDSDYSAVVLFILTTGVVAELDLPVAGYTNMLDYLAHNTDVPITVMIGDNKFHYASYLPTSYGYKWSPYVENGKRKDGLHIGWERTPSPVPELDAPAVTWNQPATTPPPEEFKSYKLRYLIADTGNIDDAEATITAQTTGPSPLPSGAPIFLPLHSDTIPFWNYGLDFKYNTDISRITSLSSVGLSPWGFFLNAEDIPPHPADSTVALAKMEADPRFYKNLSTGTYSELAWKGLREINDARANHCAELIPTYNIDYSCVYGHRYPEYFYSGFSSDSVLKKNGRRMASMSVYSYRLTAAASTLYYTCMTLGLFVRDFSHADIHLFQGWMCASMDVLPGLTVSESVMFTKLMLFCGSFKIWAYSEAGFAETNNPHYYWSTMAALDDMQPYHEYIINGKNFNPPAGTARSWSQYSGGTEVVTAWWYTNFYGKDYNGNTINANTWICCRTWENKAIFFAGTTDGVERTVSVLSPSMQKITLTADPFGVVTIED